MASSAEPTAVDRSDARTIVVSGIKLGVVTVIGVVGYALLARALNGTTANVVESVIVLLGGAVFAYLPSLWIRPRGPDGIAWATMVGLLGALTFTVIDTAALRPLHIYSWRWDAIGGGSGVWYIPVWWMGSAFLAWFGGMVSSAAARNNPNFGTFGTAAQTMGLGVVLFAVLAATKVTPFHPAAMALAFTLALVLHAAVTGLLNRR